MKIDKASGRIEFDRGVLERNTGKLPFLASNLGEHANILVENGEFLTYGIRPERGIAATVRFEGAKLKAVSWQFELSAEREREWSEDNELERKRLHDRWLSTVLGAQPWRYSWGVVESDYDAKGCASSIILSYAD